MKIVILANEIGARLWPLTSAALPKALLSLYSSEPMIVETLARCTPLCISSRDVFIVTTTAAKRTIRERKIHTQFKIPLKNILTIDEPNAIYQVVHDFSASLSDSEVIAFVPADQFYWPAEGFAFHLNNTIAGAKTHPDTIYDIGMQPGMPAGSMSYIKVHWENKSTVGHPYIPPGEDMEQGASIMETASIPAVDFKQPMDVLEAEQLVSEGYVWDLRTLVATLGAFKKHLPNGEYTVPEMIRNGVVSIALANKVIWSVLDNWVALKYLTQDAGIFPVKEDPQVHSIDSFGNLVQKSTGKEVILIGVQDLIVVETEDKLLIATPGGIHEHL